MLNGLNRAGTVHNTAGPVGSTSGCEFGWGKGRGFWAPAVMAPGAFGAGDLVYALTNDPKDHAHGDAVQWRPGKVATLMSGGADAMVNTSGWIPMREKQGVENSIPPLRDPAPPPKP